MSIDAGAIADALRGRILELVSYFYGEPNRAQSTRSELRWRGKGSFALHLTGSRAGRWDDYEAGTGGDSLDLIRAEIGCDLPGAIRWAADWLGGGTFDATPRAPQGRPLVLAGHSTPGDTANDRSALARDLWGSAVEPRGTPVETYLASRGLALDGVIAGRVIRFHPACAWQADDGTRTRVPAMVSAMTDITTSELRAVHRTALTPGGEKVGKKMLGRASGAVIRLSADEDVTLGLAITEGIENGLSVIAQGIRPVWACGSSGAIARLPVLSGIGSLTIYADHDRVGIDAARAVAERWAEAGVEAEIIYPPRAGSDWNDWVGGTAA
jgi:hypothetical protein